MIKGRYVCQVEVDFEYDEKDLKIKYAELHDRVMGDWINHAMQEAVVEVFKGMDSGFITVTKQFADITQEGEQP